MIGIVKIRITLYLFTATLTCVGLKRRGIIDNNYDWFRIDGHVLAYRYFNVLNCLYPLNCVHKVRKNFFVNGIERRQI